MSVLHFVVREPVDALPYTEQCWCEIGADHDAAAWLDNDDEPETEEERWHVTTNQGQRRWMGATP